MNYIKVNINKNNYSKIIQSNNGFIIDVIYSENDTEYKCYEFFSNVNLTDEEIDSIKDSIYSQELSYIIKKKQKEIDDYDSSSAVNSFSYNGNDYWLDKATRVGLMNSTTILKDSDETTANLWLGSMHLTLPINDVITKLQQLEVYALQCYNVTAQHKAEVSAL
jgi:hypothetical protein